MAHDLSHLLTPAEAQRLLGRRLKGLRLHLGWKRTTLADRSGVSTRSIQRFEDSGEVSLKSLLRLAHALDRLHELADLLVPPAAETMAELQERATRPAPKRGRI